jgi:pimeloyl-ACP methyl ester carboxylesterase
MELHHVRAGDGPPLLLLHGIGMSHAAWVDVVPRLADAFTCFAVDLPGFGASPRLARAQTLGALAEACAAFMAAQGFARFHVAGNSLGGGVALRLALEGRVDSACGLSPVGFVGGWDRAWLHVALAATKVAGPLNERLAPVVARPAVARRALLALYAAHGERLSVEATVAGFADLNRATAFGDTRRHALNWQCPAVGGALPCPVTVAWGDRDRLLVFGRQAPRARERLPGAQHVTLSDVGHLPTWDDPDRVARVVRAAAGGGARA